MYFFLPSNNLTFISLSVSEQSINSGVAPRIARMDSFLASLLFAALFPTAATPVNQEGGCSCHCPPISCWVTTPFTIQLAISVTDRHGTYWYSRIHAYHPEFKQFASEKVRPRVFVSSTKEGNAILFLFVCFSFDWTQLLGNIFFRTVAHCCVC